MTIAHAIVAGYRAGQDWEKKPRIGAVAEAERLAANKYPGDRALIDAFVRAFQRGLDNT